ncbi:25S rRNA (cytosine-C(5))-methyltransferase rcm1 [Acrodontium crateriforme]|uniref:25S rRNA (Cytosine-C(5))-methyltransferase rcm1 n=1 Tax=Acrodontium crateriforme TaxID=150365 RepID=A0AAQ3MD25_9PEZI|nr:25S rRNA (cytosine-C(5))-methyltransferase rcm1 [Acrodontium crateriforme]
MSLYHEAAGILDAASKESGSLKSLVFGKKTWKSDQKTLFALTSEAAKWSAVLSEVVEKSGILKTEKQLTPTLALVLSHDLLLSKRGVALPQKHGLNLTISRSKARLTSELTKARIRRGFATIDGLRQAINNPETSAQGESGDQKPIVRHPRWIRVNAIKSSLEKQLQTTFSDYVQVESLSKLSGGQTKSIYLDPHIPNLVAIVQNTDIMRSKAYRTGELILQDKASCFPAYLLDPRPDEGLVIDACAAPGNKTTHVAAILSERASNEDGDSLGVIACEKNPARSQTLEKMVKIAGGDSIISIKAKQDFTKLDPESAISGEVTALLLDPSCSGSGIVGRDESTVDVHLPSASASESSQQSKKRKRSNPAKIKPETIEDSSQEDPTLEEQPMPAEEDGVKLQARLSALSSFQLRIIEHAMSFPAAKRITYSTCSVHPEENEHVVMKALASSIAAERGWRIMRRDQQVDGMRRWHIRGWKAACELGQNILDDANICDDAETIADACIRCDKLSEDGTMGFFVAGFVRDAAQNGDHVNQRKKPEEKIDHDGDDAEEWAGFDD